MQKSKTQSWMPQFTWKASKSNQWWDGWYTIEWSARRQTLFTVCCKINCSAIFERFWNVPFSQVLVPWLYLIRSWRDLFGDWYGIITTRTVLLTKFSKNATAFYFAAHCSTGKHVSACTNFQTNSNWNRASPSTITWNTRIACTISKSMVLKAICKHDSKRCSWDSFRNGYLYVLAPLSRLDNCPLTGCKWFLVVSALHFGYFLYLSA